jgi:hypothetical protein
MYENVGRFAELSMVDHSDRLKGVASAVAGQVKIR